MDNEESNEFDDFQSRCEPNSFYKVTITIISRGCSRSARVESRFSRGSIHDGLEMMSDTSVGSMNDIDSLPFATLLQIEDALELAEFYRENGFPRSNYSPGVKPAAEIIGASLLGHLHKVIDNSPK